MQAEEINIKGAILMASAAVVVWSAIAIKARPLLSIQRAVIGMRACGKLARFAWRAAWAERRRWHQCVEDARRDA